jgi:hypothetical protein
MKFRGTAALFAVMVVLGGWVYFTDIRGAEEREREAEEAGLALPVDSADIRRLRLTYPDSTMEASRSGGNWEFISPPGLEADNGAWDQLSSNVPRIEREETILSGTAPRDLESFGLDMPSLGVQVELEDGSSEEILFGRENPGGTHYYARLASVDEVFLAPSSWISTLRKEVNDLRDKSVLRFDRDAIDRIEISGSVERILERDGETWALVAPLESPAALTEIDTFLGDLVVERATGFGGRPDDPLTAQEAGLDEARLRIAVHDSVADQDHVLLVGGRPESQPGSFYAKDQSRETVFIIDADIVESAEQSVFEWRDKKIAEFDRASVASIRIERGDDSLVLSMGDSGWELPGQGLARLETISLMFNAIEFERVTDIIDSPESLSAYGLDNPRLRVIFETDDGEALAFGFGQETPDGDSLYWKSEAESQIKAVARSVFDRFDLTSEELLDTDTSDVDP